MEATAEVQSLNVDNATDDEQMCIDEEILRIIDSKSDKTVRPGLVAAQLGISVEDASAELSGLLAAVGGGIDGATFRFERIGEATTMVFTFPHDFRKRALRKRRDEDLKAVLLKFSTVLVKVLKIVTAFGLIISLLIVSIAALIGIVAVMIALSRVDNDHRQISLLNHQLRSVIYSVRQLLWFYAVFGPENDETGDPFLKEIAYDLWLFLSLCCGNPASIFFWMRADHFSRRRTNRRWSTLWDRTNSGIPGVTLVNELDGARVDTSSLGPRRGFLSVAVEFLFGPTPFSPRPSENEKWILRANVILQKMSSQRSCSSVALEALSPYTDRPPRSPDDTATIIEQGMMIVAHFHGMPYDGEAEKDVVSKQRFVFPELMAESSHVTNRGFRWTEEDDDLSWKDLLYMKENPQPRSLTTVPKFLKESRYKFTRLSSSQLLQCIVLGSLNLVGVLWLQQSVSTGGVIEVQAGTLLATFVLGLLVPTLKFYALLFFALPLGRLGIISIFNAHRLQNNRRRAILAENIESSD